MANNWYQVLTQWHPLRDDRAWVLVTVVRVRGSNYRKAGAMMLISELGDTLGLISGGCVEKSLLTEVKKVLSSNESALIEIDSSQDGKSAALGCGGQVSLWLQLVTYENGYQALDQLLLTLHQRKTIYYLVDLSKSASNEVIHSIDIPSIQKKSLVMRLQPARHLGIFGAGIDAKPLAAMAQLMGWQITLVETRAGFGSAADFPGASILRCDAESIEVKSLVKQLDAAVVMTHNLALDAVAIKQVLAVDYVGLLGPKHRREKVFAMAGLVDDSRIHGPMGLNLGGDLPEAIALSVVAEIHQALEVRDRVEAQLINAE